MSRLPAPGEETGVKLYAAIGQSGAKLTPRFRRTKPLLKSLFSSHCAAHVFGTCTWHAVQKSNKHEFFVDSANFMILIRLKDE